MIYRSIDMIFEPSGQPIPSEEEVRFEAREILQRSGWGIPLIERLRKIADPYWREALTRRLMDQWREMVRDKDEQTYYYDSDGDIRYCWQDAEYDFGRIIRRCTAELRSAANASAAKLVAAIRTNEALGYLDTKNMSSRALYDALNDRFGLKYSVRNFTMARNK